MVPEKVLQKKSYAWHAHDVREVLSMFELTTDGLSPQKAARLLTEVGKNSFTEVPIPSLFSRVFGQLKSPLAFVLLLAFIVTAVLEEYVDSGVILFALMIAVMVGVLQEGKASRAFQKLASSQVKTATVIRGGKRHEISAEELVPGDIVVIQNGMQVPADMRLIEAKKLSINEAALTGEWMPINKQTKPVHVGQPLAERVCMAWMGTFVAGGQGLGIVVATGDSTEVGKLAGNLQEVEEVKTPLQHEMSNISHIMLYIIGVLVVIIFMIGLWQGQSLHDMLLMSIAIAVASIPEGLPAAVTIILAVGMEALLKRGGLVRNLLAAETLGSTTYILTDKTGTLTKAQMTLTELLLCEGECIEKKLWDVDSNVREVIDIALGATDAYVDDDKDGIIRGDSVERAILEAARLLEIDPERNSLRSDRIDFLPFESENRFAVGLSKIGRERRLCINGAPELLLERATHIETKDGVVPLTLEKLQEIGKQITAKTAEGKRLLAVAYKDVEYDDIPEDDLRSVVSDLVFVGVLVLDDPLREGIDAVVHDIQGAGAKILLVTGDNPATALAIAQAAGIAGPGSSVLTGDKLADMSDEDILDALPTTPVFARILPTQKMRIAQILQVKGEIVAMTGDGINDAPALKRANIGVAIGSGTEVAKESSDLVLVNDTFATIYAAIEEGRRIIANLRKILGYLLATSLSEVVLIGTAMLVGAAAPILPAQILWANVIEEGLMSVAFAFEKGEKGAMKRRPRDIHEEGILSRDMLVFLTFVIGVLSVLLLSLYFYITLVLKEPLEEVRSVMFLAISMDSLFVAFAFRSLTTPIWKIPILSNMFFVGSFIISGALLALVLTIPFFQHVLSYTPIPMYDVVLVVGFGVATLFTIEMGKWIFFERRN